ncbi:VanW family protein [Lawsonibacter sp. LCP25S3_F5]
MSGQRIEKTPKGEHKKGRKGAVLAGVAAAVVLCGYLGLCAWAGGRDAILPHVSISGLDVSGMTQDQAADALKNALAEESGDPITLNISCEGWSGQLSAADLAVDQEATVQAAMQAGEGPFLARGGQYLAHLLGAGSQVELALQDQQPALTTLLEDMERQVGDVTMAHWQVSGQTLELTKGVTGLAADEDQAVQLLHQALDQGFAQKFGQGEQNVTVDVDLPVTQTPPQEPDFDTVHQDVYTEPKDAALDGTTHEIVAESVGLDFDPAQLKAAYDQAGEGETVSIPLTVTQPKETKASLSAKLFRDLLGKGTTKVGGSAARKNNVALSAKACNGVILLPGEVFSYNGTTGSRSADKGYQAAPVYVGGASTDEVGGGICQTSSTIYYAVLHTTLEVVERRSHMYNTGYVPAGMDATVYYGSTDFRFKNNTNYPVKIVTESYDQGGSRYLTVKLYGTNETGTYAVPKSTTYDQVTPTTQYKADSSIPRGTTQVDRKQNPYTGVKAKTVRYVYNKDGSLKEEQIMGASTYKMRPKTIYYNPADGDPTTWVNGVPPQPATTPSTGENTTPSTPAETPATETPAETGGTETPAQDAQG